MAHPTAVAELQTAYRSNTFPEVDVRWDVVGDDAQAGPQGYCEYADCHIVESDLCTDRPNDLPVSIGRPGMRPCCRSRVGS